MRVLYALILVGTIHAANLAGRETMAQESGPGPEREDAYQLVQEDHGAGRDRERRTGPEVSENPRFRDYRLSPYEHLASFETPPVDECPCGPLCKCPDPMVCKNGDCKQNYVIFFTADWCHACQSMYPRIKELRDAGYIVYVFDVDKFHDAGEQFKVRLLPTTVIMDAGKEIERFIGVVPKQRITDRLKTRQQQDSQYDFSR